MKTLVKMAQTFDLIDIHTFIEFPHELHFELSPTRPPVKFSETLGTEGLRVAFKFKTTDPTRYTLKCASAFLPAL